MRYEGHERVEKGPQEAQAEMDIRIEIDPKVCGGKPVIRGTRIPVSVILDQLATGESWESLLSGYPELSREDLQAALRYARNSIETSELVLNSETR